MTKEQLEIDVQFLARRAAQAGHFECNEHRDWGMSSNSLVGMAYGIGKQYLPSDWSDYAACARAVRSLPRHRRTPNIIAALKRGWNAVNKKYPVAGRRAYMRSRKAA